MNDYEVYDEYAFVKKDMSNVDMSNVTQINGVPYLKIINSPYFNSAIFIFGDVHKYTKKGFGGDVSGSMYLPLYLDALFKKYPNKHFDLIVEVKYTKNAIHRLRNGTSGVIRNTVKQFFNCYETLYDKTKCEAEYPNVRVHFGDLRGLDQTNENKSNNLDDIQLSRIRSMREIGEKLNFWFNDRKMQKELNNMLKECDKMDIKDRSDCYLSLLLTIKQRLDEFQPGKYGEFVFNLLESGDSKFARYRKIDGYTELKRYITHDLDLISFCFNPKYKIDKLLARDKPPASGEVWGIIKDLESMSFNTGSTLFNYYALIRLLKIKEYGKENNIVLLAGQSHARVIASFVRYIDKNYMTQFSNLVGGFGIKNYLPLVMDNYKNVFPNDIFVLEIYTINKILLLYYLEKIRRNLIELENKNEQVNKLLLTIDNLLKLCEILMHSKYKMLGGEECAKYIIHPPEPYGYRYVSVKSSEIESSLYVKNNWE